MTKDTFQKRREFAEAFGVLFERVGLPCMAGRIWGWLLTSAPPYQTAAEIAEGLSASRGSVSTMAGLLLQLGVIERVGMPGERNKLYRLRSGGFTEILKQRMRLMTELRMTVERGLDLLKDEPPDVRGVIEEYHDLCVFFEKEFPAMIAKWERMKRQGERGKRGRGEKGVEEER